MSYLKQKPGSIEEVINKLSSKVLEGDYQDKFKKELEKAGKGIGAMTPKEKSAFFNKVDKMHKAKDEQATKGDIDKFHKKLDNLVHKSFGHSSDEKKMKKEEVDIEETHMGQTAKANQSQKDAKGEKEVIKPLSMKETLQKMWQEAAEKKEEALTNAEKKKEEEQNKNKKTTDTGEKPSEIETKPEIKYAN